MDFEQKYQKDPGMNRVRVLQSSFLIPSDLIVEYVFDLGSIRREAHLPQGDPLL